MLLQNAAQGEGPNGGPKASSTSTPEAPYATKTWSGWGGEKKRRGLGTLRQRELGRC